MESLGFNQLKDGMFVQVNSYYYNPRYGYLTDESVVYRGVLQNSSLDIPGRIIRFFSIYGADKHVLTDKGWDLVKIDKYVVGITKDNISYRQVKEITDVNTDIE